MSKMWLGIRQKGVVGTLANRRLMLCLKAVRLLLSSSMWLPRRSAGPAWLDFPIFLKEPPNPNIFYEISLATNATKNQN